MYRCAVHVILRCPELSMCAPKRNLFLLQLHLESVITLRPSLLQLGVRGSMLLARLLSLPRGYQQFNAKQGFIQQQVDHWNKVSSTPSSASSSNKSITGTRSVFAIPTQSPRMLLVSSVCYPLLELCDVVNCQMLLSTA